MVLACRRFLAGIGIPSIQNKDLLQPSTGPTGRLPSSWLWLVNASVSRRVVASAFRRLWLIWGQKAPSNAFVFSKIANFAEEEGYKERDNPKESARRHNCFQLVDFGSSPAPNSLSHADRVFASSRAARIVGSPRSFRTTWL